MNQKKYVIVGSGGRSYSFYSEMVSNFKEHARLLAFCDTTQARTDNANMVLQRDFDHPAVKTYKHEQFNDLEPAK